MAPGPALNASPAFPSVHAVRLHWRGGHVRCVSVQPEMVSRGLPAVDDAQVRAAPAKTRWRWRKPALALAAFPLRAAKRLLLAGGEASWAPAHASRTTGRPLAWPYADGAPGWRNHRFLPEAGVDHFAFAPDAIVDQSGRILRL